MLGRQSMRTNSYRPTRSLQRFKRRAPESCGPKRTLTLQNCPNLLPANGPGSLYKIVVQHNTIIRVQSIQQIIQMGCGACIEPKTSQPSSTTHSISPILENWISKYEGYASKQKQQANTSSSLLHPVLSLQQCKLIRNLIASSGGYLPQVRFDGSKQQKSVQDPAGVPTGCILLTQTQRIIWKCFLIIPSHINQDKIDATPTHKFKLAIEDSEQKVENSFYQISLDVNRTFPTVKHLSRSDLNTVLRNVVNAVSGIGYTQGMNFYAGFLLLCGFTPEQCYYMLLVLLIDEPYFLCHNFTPNFSLVATSNSILASSLPEHLSEHLNNIGITEQIYSFSWFLCCFVYTLRVETCAILWDWMIKAAGTGIVGAGYSTIINISILMMEKLQHALMAIDTPQGIMGVFRAENLNKIITPAEMTEMIKQLKRRSQKYQSLKPSSKQQTNFRKQFVTQKQLMEQDKELKTALSSREGYRKYVGEVLGWNRNQNNQAKQEEEKIVIMGPVQKINIESEQQNNQS